MFHSLTWQSTVSLKAVRADEWFIYWLFEFCRRRMLTSLIVKCMKKMNCGLFSRASWEIYCDHKLKYLFYHSKKASVALHANVVLTLLITGTFYFLHFPLFIVSLPHPLSRLITNSLDLILLSAHCRCFIVHIIFSLFWHDSG